MICYLNGSFVNESEAKVSTFDRGFLFGDGIYEVVPVVGGKVFDVDGFWERFLRSLGEISLKTPATKDEILEIFKVLLEKNKLDEGGIYLQVTRGAAKRQFEFLDLEQTFFVYSYETQVVDNPLAKTGIKVISTEDIRWKRKDIKSISLLAQCIAKNEAVKQGAYEAFMVENGFVTEGASSTAYIVKNNTIITAPLSSPVLPGVRRKNLVQIAKKLGINFQERHFSIDEVKTADEAFISAATLLLLPVVNIDGHDINGAKVGKITQALRDEYVLRTK